MRKLVYITGLVFGFLNSVKAQDAQFSQFYANPIFLNPAFTGATYDYRVVGNFREQWPGIKKGFQSYAISYDNNLDKLNSGVGLQVFRDVSGTSQISNTYLGGSYAYRATIADIKELRFGINASYVFHSINNTGLVFNDQLYTKSETSNDPYFRSMLTAKGYMDVNAGGLFMADEYWLGISAHHLTQPKTSFGVKDAGRLSVKWSVHGGYRFIMDRKGVELLKYVSPCLNYKHQGNFDNLDLGVLYYAQPLSLGLWYRGLPMKKYDKGYINQDAISVLVGFDLKKYDSRIGFSYDVTMAKLGVARTFGAFELSWIYEPARKAKKTRKVLVSAPKF